MDREYLFLEAKDHYQFWMRCIAYASIRERTAANIQRWATHAIEAESIMIGAASA